MSSVQRTEQADEWLAIAGVTSWVGATILAGALVYLCVTRDLSVFAPAATFGQMVAMLAHVLMWQSRRARRLAEQGS